MDEPSKRLAAGQYAWNRGESLDTDKVAVDEDPWFAYGWCYSSLLDCRDLMEWVVDGYTGPPSLAESMKELIRRLNGALPESYKTIIDYNG